MRFDRQSGVFAHVASLPGPHGIGDLGSGARAFVDFLRDAGQSLWQFCPLGPTSGAHGNSPYQSYSAFAGEPTFVSLERLAERPWFDDADVPDDPGFDSHRVAYDRVREFKREALRTAFECFRERAADDERERFAGFREREAGWVEDYALFRACKAEFDGAAWADWPEPIRTREPAALDRQREALADDVAFNAFRQWLFDEQWRDLRAYAADREVSLVGDLPIYVALDSADVWATPAAFDLGPDRQPAAVAGVPPNPGDDGQRWGNPVYDWDHLRETGYEWWLDRVRRLLSRVDIARIDHFKGFDEFWAIPADAESPAAGEWRDGPGADFFEAVADDLDLPPEDLPFVAEDLGFIDEGVVALRDRFSIPGMRVPQYADWCSEDSRDKPVNYPRDAVAYTSTHDTDTAVGYYESLGDEQRDCLHYALATDGSEIHWSLIEAVWDSEASIAMTTMQDLLGLGSDARFNTPGTAEGNWRWRVTEAALTDDVATELAGITTATLR